MATTEPTSPLSQAAAPLGATLIDYIDRLSATQVAADLGVTVGTISKVHRRLVEPGGSLLARAAGRYGRALDLHATMALLRPEDYAAGADGALDRTQGAVAEAIEEFIEVAAAVGQRSAAIDTLRATLAKLEGAA